MSGSRDQTIQLWDVATGALLQTLEGHTDSVTSVAFSPNGKQVVSGSDDETVRLWDAATGALLQTLEGYNHWVVEGDTNIIWLPPKYREYCFATWNRSLVFGHIHLGEFHSFALKKEKACYVELKKNLYFWEGPREPSTYILF